MSVVLSIGGRLWLAPDMAKAGKVADLLNSFRPVHVDYRNSDKRVFVQIKGHEHEMEIKELPFDAQVVKSVDEAIKLRGKNDAKSKDLL